MVGVVGSSPIAPTKIGWKKSVPVTADCALGLAGASGLGGVAAGDASENQTFPQRRSGHI